MDALRLAYLDAMGIEVWRLRDRTEPPVREGAGAPRRLAAGPGGGDILCICGSEEEQSGKLARDIGRAMRCPPMWAWPAPESAHGGGTQTLPGLIAERMLTRVLIFGAALEPLLFEGRAPEVIAAARVHVVPGLERLAGDPGAKRTLWRLMCDEGIADPGPTGKERK